MPDKIENGKGWAAAVQSHLDARGWSRYRLAQEIGVPRETCCRWLRVGAVPGAKHRASVSLALGDERLRQVTTSAEGVLSWG
jgi:ribosome-binding protein aMBF1 (putative translation factor)